MKDTMFLPPAALRAADRADRDAAVRCRGRAHGPATMPFLRGVVHDPTARRMDGVAGHAGLFSTAADLSRFCRMLLDGGRLDGARILSPATVARMTSPATPAGDARRARPRLGHRLDRTRRTAASCFRSASFGHTGFTGTSLWLDPATKSYVVFLSNRVHPDGKGDVTRAARQGRDGRGRGAVHAADRVRSAAARRLAAVATAD